MTSGRVMLLASASHASRCGSDGGRKGLAITSVRIDGSISLMIFDPAGDREMMAFVPANDAALHRRARLAVDSGDAVVLSSWRIPCQPARAASTSLSRGIRKRVPISG